MIVLLGASGYVGQAFAQALRERNETFVALTRKEVNYTRFEVLLNYLRQARPTFLINAAGYTGSPNVDACEIARAETLLGNSLFPQTVAHACLAANLPWGHVSSGCIYAGAKIVENGKTRVEKDLMRPEVFSAIRKNPAIVQGFTERDAPNFSFREGPCSFYSGTKALGEEVTENVGQVYLWRLRIPFDEFDNPRNYLTKVQRYAKVYENVNSVSHRGDFVRACLDTWKERVPFGTYNITNPGFIDTRQVISLIEKILKPGRKFEFWEDDAEFYRLGAKTPRSNCVLDATKLLATGVKLRPVTEAIEDSLRRWRAQ